MRLWIVAFTKTTWILAWLTLVTLLAWGIYSRISKHRPPPDPATTEMHRLAAELSALEADERQVAEHVWGPDLLAQHCGRVFEELWDHLNAAPDKFELLGSVPFHSIQPGHRNPVDTLGHGITLFRPAGVATIWTTSDWQHHLKQWREAGWEIGAVEFRHIQFEAQDAQPKSSIFHFRAQLMNGQNNSRATLQGDLEVEWATSSNFEDPPGLQHVDAQNVTIAVREAPPAFEQVLNERVVPPEKSFFIDPLILHDLDGDGLSEILLVASNTVFRRRPDGSFERALLCRHPPGLIFTAVVADFDGDGVSDLLCARHDGLFLYQGSGLNHFDGPGRLVWTAPSRIRYGQVLTCGDADGDGDLDVWLGQYKPPYERGQMPTPYYDANDGYPSYLLLNDSHGSFTDATDAAGLGRLRFRRTYSASLVDLDLDGDLDLVVVSDFAGVDLYTNDGHARFTQVDWIREPHGFGMAHVFADFDRSGTLDLFMSGMHCPTALRLDHLGLVRPGYENYAQFRRPMTAGNRLWTAAAQGGFKVSTINPSVANSGWTWGCTAFDADNDGWPDLYVVNGHESRQSVRDYEPEFWLHDIYVGNSSDDLLRTAYFGAKIARTRGRGWSYGGYEMNRLYLNRSGEEFVELGHLFGLGLQLDCRTAVADDLDGDGRMDLLTTTFEVWPKANQSLQIYRNTLASGGSWIGFRLNAGTGDASPVGASVSIQTSDYRTVRAIVAGDSHRAQHSWTMHFGLGTADAVEAATVQWPNREPLVISRPVINQYHVITAAP